jgi:hypothetical protein
MFVETPPICTWLVKECVALESVRYWPIVQMRSLARICFFFFIRHYNPIWVSACSTVVEHSQQEGFTECRCQRHVKPPNLEKN